MSAPLFLVLLGLFTALFFSLYAGLALVLAGVIVAVLSG